MQYERKLARSASQVRLFDRISLDRGRRRYDRFLYAPRVTAETLARARLPIDLQSGRARSPILIFRERCNLRLLGRMVHLPYT